MKLSILCAILLVCSFWVITQQKQKLEELKAELAVSSQTVGKLQEEVANLKKHAAAQGSQVSQSSAPEAQQQPPAQNGAWMYGKGATNPLELHGLGTSGGHK